jgi:hypothetical protein
MTKTSPPQHSGIALCTKKYQTSQGTVLAWSLKTYRFRKKYFTGIHYSLELEIFFPDGFWMDHKPFFDHFRILEWDQPNQPSKRSA